LINKFFKKLIKGRFSKIGTANLSFREEWLKNKINEIPDGFRILDAGAGELKYKKLCSHLNYVSQDFLKYDGKGNKKGLQTGNWQQENIDIISDIIKISEKKGSFNAIMCIEVFEHLPDPISVIKEFNRLLKYKGILLLTAPFASLTHFAPFHYYSGFNKYFFEKYLTDFNFKIEEIIPNGNFFEYISQELRRLPFILENYCFKKINIRDKLAIENFLKILERLSAGDKGSSDLLNFGYNIKAVKINK